MPILFSAVARESNIVSQFASCDGNFIEIFKQVMSKTADRDHKMTYFHGPYLIHYVLENQHMYFCITDKMCQRSRAFLFLNEIHRKFVSEGKNNFVQILAAQMYTYSEDYSTIVVRKGEVDEVNTIGVESSETILGEKVLLVNNPENISYATVSYVGRSPEQVSISEEKSRFYIVIIGLIMFVIGMFYLLSPMTCAVIVAVIGISFMGSFRTKEKTD